MRIALVVATVAAALVILPADVAFACSCVSSPSDEKALRTSDAVFTGTVVDKDDPKGDARVISSARPITWTFDVDRVDKGDVGTTQDVVTAADGASCGFRFTEGKRYLVFAYAEEGGLQTNICTNTRAIEASSPAPEESGSDDWWLVVAVAAGMSAAGVVWWRLRA